MTAGASAREAAQLCRTLHDISQLLESADGAEERVRRALMLLGRVVPNEECAILDARLGFEPHVIVVPEVSLHEQVRMTARLLDLFGQLVDSQPRPRVPKSPGATHLAVPLIGLDEVVGLLMVRSSVTEYTEDHLRALSVVAADLAAYFTMLRARSEIAEIARERDEARRAAEAANRAKDEFLAVVSHQLKVPLSAILAQASLLRTSADAPERARALDEIERNVETQAQLVDGVLELASVGSAELRLDRRPAEPAALLRAAVEGLRLAAARKPVRIHADIEPGEMPLLLDPNRIAQVLSILIANAIQRTEPGGRIEVRLRRASDAVRIVVSDNGSGIPAEELPRIFDPFPATGSLDVGLAIGKQLVELHGGRAWVESAGSQRGASFSIELPRAQAAAGGPRLVGQGERADGRPLTGIRVLLVDHDEALRESFQTVLEDHGATFTAVASAAEALGEVRRSRPDVLLFGDLEVPGETVYDVMREVTARMCPLPVASISAWRVEDKERERAVGFRLHLAKPLDVNALIDAVTDLAGRPRRSSQRLAALPSDGPRRKGRS